MLEPEDCPRERAGRRGLHDQAYESLAVSSSQRARIRVGLGILFCGFSPSGGPSGRW